MKTIVINENQRGLIFRNGKYMKTVGAGKYRLPNGSEVEVSDFGRVFQCSRCPLETLLEDANFASQVSVCEVNDGQVVLHFVNGRLISAIERHGKYAFWNGKDVHEFRAVDISVPDVPADFPKQYFDRISALLYKKVEVAPFQKGCLFFDHRFARVLEPGVYYFWNGGTDVDVNFVDMRLTQMNLMGQEILTQDKVGLRINFTCNYRITDCVRILTEIDDYEEQIHVASQLALREYVGQYRLDEILEKKEEVSAFVCERLKAREKELFVEISDIGIKDIILPGEIRDIMNTVLVAEKKAQANVITRREEVASTRSLLNTAKLMEENRTLYKLKELEYVEHICENVGNINLTGGDMLSQLMNLIGGKNTEKRGETS